MERRNEFSKADIIKAETIRAEARKMGDEANEIIRAARAEGKCNRVPARATNLLGKANRLMAEAVEIAPSPIDPDGLREMIAGNFREDTADYERRVAEFTHKVLVSSQEAVYQVCWNTDDLVKAAFKSQWSEMVLERSVNNGDTMESLTEALRAVAGQLTQDALEYAPNRSTSGAHNLVDDWKVAARAEWLKAAQSALRRIELTEQGCKAWVLLHDKEAEG